MKKSIIAAVALTLPSIIAAQSSIDVYNLNPYQLRGTSRFMSMGGAFTALGGDLSTLNQNPGGIGIYRNSEIGATLDIDIQSAKSTSPDGYSLTNNQTKAACDNFGYIGAVNLGNDIMPYFTWGVSYGRAASFDRLRSGGSVLGGSLSNYIADFTTSQATKLSDLSGEKTNPYDGTADWLSILAYNGYLISPTGERSYQGLWQKGTSGDAMFSTQEKGYIDEYNIDFGGNINNTVFWGMGFGITDLNYTANTFYDEDLANARIPAAGDDPYATTKGDAYYQLSNWQHTNGAGFNFKVGVIVKPINELRIGLAVHTPTYYNLTTSYSGDIYFQYTDANGQATHDCFNGGNDKPSYTDIATYDWKMRSPTRLMAGVATVLGGKAIVSADYEHQFYNAMKAQDYFGYDLTDVNQDITNTFKGSDIIRIGAEFRPTSHLSVRAGFNYCTSNAQKGAIDSNLPVYTAGTNPSYTLHDDTYYITAGLGYRYKGFYADLAYVYRHAQSTWHGFNALTFVTESQDYIPTGAPTASIAQNDNHITMSIGFKF